MEENVESKVVKEKLDKAFKKLWTLDRLDQKSLRTSKYNFGVEKPFINDRGTFYIKLGASTIKCQIVFDSNNYDFPPDILFHQLPKEVIEVLDDTSVLLPSGDWDLDNEECLYGWIQRILNSIFKEPSIEENNDEKYKKGLLSDDDDVFEDTKKDSKKVKDNVDAKVKGESDEQKPKKTWSIFKEIDDELDSYEESIKSDPDKKKESKRGFFDDKNDDMGIFEIFKKNDEENKKTSVINVKNKEQPTKTYADIEFEDDDFLKYNSSCDVVDTTMNNEEDVEMDEVVDTTKNRRYIPDVEIISSSSKAGKEKNDTKEEKPIGRIGANLVSLKRKLKKKEPSSANVDDSIFDFPTSPSTLSSLYKSPTATKRQAVLTSPQRPGTTTSKAGFTIEKKPKDVVNLIIDDNDDFEEPPPTKIRKKEQQTKIFDLGSSKASQQRQIKSTDTGSQTKSREEYRKKFMTTWLNRFRARIIEYDAENYEQFSLYFTFGVTTTNEVWVQYNNQLEFTDDIEVNFKPKRHAPVLVQFRMDSSFPLTDLKIKVISVLNTDSVGSDKPETMDLKYHVTEAETISNIVDNIMDLLKAKVLPFHYQLKEDVYF